MTIKLRKVRKQFCPKGHDTFICGRTKEHGCRECGRIRDRKQYIPHPIPKKQFCLRGHDTAVTGRYKDGVCIVCAKLKSTRENKLKYRFGITVTQYDEMFDKQSGKCPGCGRDQSELEKRLSVDHDHETGKIRGLLCKNCNLVLGNAKDEIRILINLIEYLKKS